MRAEQILRRALLLTLAVVAAFAATAGDAMAAKPWEKFDFPELGEIRIPDYERHVLANGMTVFLLGGLMAWAVLELVVFALPRDTAKKLKLDLWYSPRGEWLGLQSTYDNGRRLRYELLSEPVSLDNSGGDL